MQQFRHRFTVPAASILISFVDIGIQIGIGIGIDGQDGNSTPIPIAISISPGRMHMQSGTVKVADLVGRSLICATRFFSTKRRRQRVGRRKRRSAVQSGCKRGRVQAGTEKLPAPDLRVPETPLMMRRLGLRGRGRYRYRGRKPFVLSIPTPTPTPMAPSPKLTLLHPPLQRKGHRFPETP